MNRTFDFYEYAGVIAPGAVLVLGLLWLFPEGRLLFSKEGVTFGELGLFVIVAYGAGQLVQGIGNYIETIWWKPWGGMPGVQVLTGGAYLSPDQQKRVREALLRELKTDSNLSGLSSAQRAAVMRELYAVVAAAGRAARVDVFNGNYGLVRGLAASLSVLLLLAFFAGKSFLTVAVLAVLFFLAIQRMHRFGKHYAVELFVQFLGIADANSAVGRPQDSSAP